MARAKRTPKPTTDINTAIHHALMSFHAKARAPRPGEFQRSSGVTFHPHLVDPAYAKARADHIMRHGTIPSNSNHILKLAAHHGVPVPTHHGIGGAKSKHVVGPGMHKGRTPKGNIHRLIK